MTDQPITVPPEKVAAIRKTLAMIQDDARDDAARTDGLALTGRNIGELFGNVLASISALAGIIDAILQDPDDAPVHVPGAPGGIVVQNRGDFELDAHGHLVPVTDAIADEQ